jgi:Domain of unknown function (DUF4258)
MWSVRFGKYIAITDHARIRMVERGLDDAVLLDLVETGSLKHVGGQHLFIFKPLPGRHDNLVCAAAVNESALVIKTVMINWTLRGES